MSAGTTIYPDLLISGTHSGANRFAVYCEHKWDSHCDASQLEKYGDLAKRKNAHLAFVGANRRQTSQAAKCFERGRYACFLWEDVYSTLNAVSEKSTILAEFLSFMDAQGLSPGKPLTVETMTAFLASRDFLKSLERLAHRLNTDYDWGIVPKRYHLSRVVSDTWGSAKIDFSTENWKPAIWLGFLHNPSDHKVSLINPQRGIDLMLRIVADPKHTREIGPAIEVLESKRSELQHIAKSVLFKGDRGNRNNYSVVIIRECLGDIIEKAETEADQIIAIHSRLESWLRALFGDGKLEKSFKKVELDSGM